MVLPASLLDEKFKHSGFTSSSPPRFCIWILAQSTRDPSLFYPYSVCKLHKPIDPFVAHYRRDMSFISFHPQENPAKGRILFHFIAKVTKAHTGK